MRTTTVHLAEVTDTVRLAATIQADPTRIVRVYPPVSGRLLGIDIQPAQHVRQGQIIAELASSDVTAARTAYEQAVADAHLKQQALDRAADLYAHRALALKDYQQNQADAQVAAATLASAKERLALLGIDPTDTSDRVLVRAPRAGVVLDVDAAPGEFAKSLDNATPLCTIADLSTVWAVGEAFEQDLARIRPGSPSSLTVAAFPGSRWRGRVDAVSSLLDPTARTASVRIALANPDGRLKPNMFGSMSITAETRSAVVLPETAVVREGRSNFVFIRSPSGHFERQTVNLGRDLDGNRVEVLSGISPGAVIAVEGATLLQAARNVS